VPGTKTALIVRYGDSKGPVMHAVFAEEDQLVETMTVVEEDMIHAWMLLIGQIILEMDALGMLVVIDAIYLGASLAAT